MPAGSNTLKFQLLICSQGETETKVVLHAKVLPEEANDTNHSITIWRH